MNRDWAHEFRSAGGTHEQVLELAAAGVHLLFAARFRAVGGTAAQAIELVNAGADLPDALLYRRSGGTHEDYMRRRGVPGLWPPGQGGAQR